MEQRIYTHSKKGALSLGAHHDGTADEQNCGAGSLSVGENTMSTGEGTVAHGYTDRAFGLVASGMGAQVHAVSLEGSTVAAKGTAARAQGRAVNKSQILASGEASTVIASVSGGSTAEATGTGAFIRGEGSDLGEMTAEGRFSSIRANVSHSGVISVKGNHSSVEGEANGGYIGVDGSNSSVHGTAAQFSKLIVRGNNTNTRANLAGSEERPARATVDAEYSSIEIQSTRGTTSIKGSYSDLHIMNNGANLSVNSVLSSMRGIALASDERLSANVASTLRGRNISSQHAFSVSAGAHGSSGGLLPAFTLFAGADGNTPPAFNAEVVAYGAFPLTSTSSTGFQSSSTGYSEMHEWADDNPLGEERLGHFVALSEGKLKIAATSESADGVVVSPSFGFVGNVPHATLSLRTDHLGRPRVVTDYSYAMNLWLIANRGTQRDVKFATEPITTEKRMLEMKSAFGIPDEVEIEPVLMVDPHFVTSNNNSAIETTHAAVCYLGTVVVIDNGECSVDERCDCVNGIAVPGSRWKVVARHSATTVRILMK